MRRTVLLLASMVVATLLAYGVALAQPGDYDGGFCAPLARHDSVVSDVAAQPDGKVVAVGAPSFEGTLVRCNQDGTLDHTFGTDGYIGDAPNRAVTIQEDGKILAGGSTTDGDFALARYNSDGSPDTSFDGDGWLTTSVSANVDTIQSIALQDDGKILAAGSSLVACCNGLADLALARYNSDGTLDDTFHGDGMRTTHFGSGGGWACCYSLTIRSDGKILVAGYSGGLVLVRYNPDGTFDDTFDGDGRLFPTAGTNVTDVVVLEDGKIVATRSPNFTLTGYNPDGTLDRTFGTNGTVTTLWSNDRKQAIASRLVLQPNGKIVAGGSVIVGGEESADFMILARYHPSGKLDPTFGEVGVVRHLVNDGWNRSATENDLELQEDGKLIWTGRGVDSDSGHVLMARFLGGEDTTPPTVIKTLPRDDATRVGRNLNILANFSEDMKATSINGKTVNLYKGAISPANEVSATVLYDADTHQAILNPSERLLASTTYTAVVEGAGDSDTLAVKDPGGLAMQADHRWNFKTTTP